MLKIICSVVLASILLSNSCNADVLGIKLGVTKLSNIKDSQISLAPKCKKAICNHDGNTYSTRYILGKTADNLPFIPVIEVENNSKEIVEVDFDFTRNENNIDKCGYTGSNTTVKDFISANIFKDLLDNFTEVKKDPSDKDCSITYITLDKDLNMIMLHANGNNQMMEVFYFLPLEEQKLRQQKAQEKTLNKATNLDITK